MPGAPGDAAHAEESVEDDAVAVRIFRNLPARAGPGTRAAGGLDPAGASARPRARRALKWPDAGLMKAAGLPAFKLQIWGYGRR